MLPALGWDHRWGDDIVAKVLDPGVPHEWADLEASHTEAVRRVGVAAPEVHAAALFPLSDEAP